MNNWIRRSALSGLFLATSVLVAGSPSPLGKPPKKLPIIFEDTDIVLKFTNKVREEAVVGKNISLLNDNNVDCCGGNLDRILYQRFTWDTGFRFDWGQTTYGCSAMTVQAQLRTKGNFGNPESIGSTARTSIKDNEYVFGEHKHPLNVHYPIVREFWAQMNLSLMFGRQCCEPQHFFKVGIFPFSVGRGISLGDSYATVNELLGYYPEDVVQQYAPGLLFTGDLSLKHNMTYDAYVAITRNRSDSFDNVNMRIRGQEFGKRKCPERGFGVINSIFAGRIVWNMIDGSARSLRIEPYVVVNKEQEQFIEFLGDAQSVLGTIGCALDGRVGRVEWGLEWAKNTGHQCVFGWDRNVVTRVSRNDIPTLQGVPVLVNSHVVSTQALNNDLVNKQAVYVVGGTNQKLIENGPQGQSYNGEIIPGTANPVLRNAPDRFTNPYRNDFGGYMFVSDVAFQLYDQVRFAATAGYASGDDNPNKDLEERGDSNIDGAYDGFIGLQETYSGRDNFVRSTFFLSGSGKVPRILSVPGRVFNDAGVPTGSLGLPTNISRFTDLAFIGGATILNFQTCSFKWRIHPNILNFWQTHPTRVFDPIIQKRGVLQASKALGTEYNIFVEGMPTRIPDLKLFMVGAIFVPGQHYNDIKGIPLNRSQQRNLEEFDRTGVTDERVPTLGDDTAIVLNMGIEYRF